MGGGNRLPRTMRTFYRSIDGQIHRKDGVLGCCCNDYDLCCTGSDFVSVLIADTVTCVGSGTYAANVDGLWICEFISEGVWQFYSADEGVTVDVTCVDGVFTVEVTRDGELGDLPAFTGTGAGNVEIPNEFVAGDCPDVYCYDGTAIVTCGGVPPVCCPDASDLLLDLFVGGVVCDCYFDGLFYYKLDGALPAGQFTLTNSAPGVWGYSGGAYDFIKYTSASDCANDVDGVAVTKVFYITVTCSDGVYTITAQFDISPIGRVFEAITQAGHEVENIIELSDCGTTGVATYGGLGLITCVTP